MTPGTVTCCSCMIHSVTCLNNTDKDEEVTYVCSSCLIVASLRTAADQLSDAQKFESFVLSLLSKVPSENQGEQAGNPFLSMLGRIK